MKLKQEHKVTLLIVGFLLAWLSLYVMLKDFYEGLVESTANFQPYYLRGGNMIIWLILMALSSVFLALGLKAEDMP